LGQTPQQGRGGPQCGAVFGLKFLDPFQNLGQAAANPRIDELREKMQVVENQPFSRDYPDPAKRAIADAVREFMDLWVA
jgi:2-methylcitrate dehydratase PrpD